MKNNLSNHVWSRLYYLGLWSTLGGTMVSSYDGTFVRMYLGMSRYSKHAELGT